MICRFCYLLSCFVGGSSGLRTRSAFGVLMDVSSICVYILVLGIAEPMVGIL